MTYQDYSAWLHHCIYIERVSIPSEFLWFQGKEKKPRGLNVNEEDMT